MVMVVGLLGMMLVRWAVVIVLKVWFQSDAWF